ncbi:MAG: hypothetical protein GQ565_04485 [Candidatus Aegiribacteria sp.]|nr:hypothetical protein [Candidatus Aegiribacteria sp.]
MKKTVHRINGNIVIIPENGMWISHSLMYGTCRVELFDTNPETLGVLKGLLKSSNRIARAGIVRIRDAGIVYDMDGNPPDRSLFYIMSDIQRGISLRELISIDPSSNAVSKLMFRTAFSLKCLGTAFCAHGALTDENVFLSSDTPTLSYPVLSPRTRIVDPMKEFHRFTSAANLNPASLDMAIKFLDYGIIPDEEISWTEAYHTMPTNWLMGMEDQLELILEAADFSLRNSYNGVNIFGRESWGARVLMNDFCVSRRLDGNIVIEIVAGSIPELRDILVRDYLFNSGDLRTIMQQISMISPGTPKDLVINIPEELENSSLQSMISEIIRETADSEIHLFFLSGNASGTDGLFEMGLPFRKARKRLLLSRITSRLKDRTPGYFGDWLSPMEYYQLITKNRSSGIAFVEAEQATSVLQGISVSFLASIADKDFNIAYPFTATGYCSGRSVWSANPPDLKGIETEKLFLEYLQCKGCSNLRELVWALNHKSLGDIEKAELLVKLFERYAGLIRPEVTVELIDLLLSCVSVEAVTVISDILLELADMRKQAIVNQPAEVRRDVSNICNRLAQMALPPRMKLIRDLLLLSSAEKQLVPDLLSNTCRKCIDSGFGKLAVLAVLFFLSAKSENIADEHYALLNELTEISEPSVVSIFIKPVILLLLLQSDSSNMENWKLFNEYPQSDPIKFPNFYSYMEIITSFGPQPSHYTEHDWSERHLMNSSFISSLFGISSLMYTTEINKISLGRDKGTLTAWEASTKITKLISCTPCLMDYDSLMISEYGTLAEDNLQQLNLVKTDELLNTFIKHWKLEADTIKSRYTAPDKDIVGQYDLLIILASLVTGKPDSLKARLNSIGSDQLLRNESAECTLVESLSDLKFMDKDSERQVISITALMDASTGMISVSQLADRLLSCKVADSTDFFMENLRRGDLLNAYLTLAQIAAEGLESSRKTLQGKVKVIRALERRYRRASMYIIKGMSPFEVLAGKDWERSLRFPRSRARMPLPDSLDELRQMLFCDAVWLFNVSVTQLKLLERSAPESFPYNVSWIISAIKRARDQENGKLLNSLGSGWEAGHSTPATATVKLDSEHENSKGYRILIAETMCPGKALTSRREKVFLDYALSL